MIFGDLIQQAIEESLKVKSDARKAESGLNSFGLFDKSSPIRKLPHQANKQADHRRLFSYIVQSALEAMAFSKSVSIGKDIAHLAFLFTSITGLRVTFSLPCIRLSAR